MAVTINGDGTISGVSVGGLPDGVVDSGTLATNSVDSAELIDGAVDNSHLATGIDATKLANGTITNSELQYINSLSSNAQTQIDGAGGQYKIVSTSYDIATTGPLVVTGAGFTPKFIWMHYDTGDWVAGRMGWGFTDGTIETSMNEGNQQTADSWSSSIGRLMNNIWYSSTYAYLDLASFDADGCTLTKSKFNSPTGTCYLDIAFFG